MAIIDTWDTEKQKGFEDWLVANPTVADLAQRFPPNKLYRMKSTGLRVTIFMYSDEGTLGIKITGKYNRVPFNTRVAGVTTTDLEECDLPSGQEQLGVIPMAQQEADAFIRGVRGKKPDLRTLN